jgi:DNA repair protein RadC
VRLLKKRLLQTQKSQCLFNSRGFGPFFIHLKSISKGGINSTVTDVRIILQYAIKANASGIVICHNHPSGNLQPSESDIEITRKIKESGNVMDVQLLDHLIMVPEGKYYSMGDEGIIYLIYKFDNRSFKD